VRSANREAVNFLKQAMNALTRLPEGEYGERCLRIGDAAGDVGLQALARGYLGYSCHAQGLFRRAHSILRENVEALELVQGNAPGGPAGVSYEWWPEGLASRMAMTRVLEHSGSAPGPATPPNGYTRRPPSVEGPDLWRAATGAGNRRPSWLTSDHYFEAELERAVCRQVVAGPSECLQPTTRFTTCPGT